MTTRPLCTSLLFFGLAGLLGVMGCGTVLGLDDYTQANSGGGGGEAGAGPGGASGQGGQGGQGGSMMAECMPNTTAPCYDGPMGTEGKGACKAGLKTCSAAGQYGSCAGQILPALENCTTPMDDDCNGTVANCTGTPAWAYSYGSTASQQFGSVIRAMTDHSIVVTGGFTEMVNFGCAPIMTAVDFQDIFLVRLDAQGTCVFAKQFGGTQANDYGYGLAIDANDDILLTGGYAGSAIDFGGGALAGQGSNDIYLARFDKTGNHLWSKHYGDNGDQLAYSVAVDAQGNIFLAGDFGGTIDFGDGVGITGLTGGFFTGFVAKLDSSGNHVYSRAFGVQGTTGYEVRQTRAVVDAEGNALVIGRFNGPLTASDAPTIPSMGAYDFFVLRYDAMGKILFAKRFGSSGDDFNIDAAIGSDGSIYLSGRIMGTSLDLSGLGGTSLPSNGNGDAFVVKLNPDGSFAKAKVFGDQMPAGAVDQAATTLAVDPLGHVLLGGYFVGNIDFGVGMPLGTAMNSTLYLAKFDANLDGLWAKPFYSTQAQTGIRVGADGLGNVLLTGGFAANLQIIPGTPLPNAGNTDIFIAKLGP